MAIKANAKVHPGLVNRFKSIVFLFCQLFIMPLGACVIYTVISWFESHQHPQLRMWLLIITSIVTVTALALNNREVKQAFK